MSTLIEEQGGGPANPPSTMIERGYLDYQLDQYPDLIPVDQALQTLQPARYDLAAHIDCSPLPDPNRNVPGLHRSGEAVYRRLQSDGLLQNCFGLEDFSGLIAIGRDVLVGCFGSLRRIYMWRSVAKNGEGSLLLPVLRLETDQVSFGPGCMRWQPLSREVSLVGAAARLRF